MLDFITIHKKSVIVILGAILALSIGWVIYYNTAVFHVVSVTPNQSSLSYLSPQVTVGFNKNIDISTNTTIEGDGIKVKYEPVGKNSIRVFILSAMSAGNTYTITLHNIKSANGDVIDLYSITLKPVNNEGSLTDEDREIILDLQDQSKSSVLSDPILTYIPYSTLDYSITPITVGDTITAEVKIQLTAADVRINKDDAINAAKIKAIGYLSNLDGIDITKYTIIYTVIEPSL